METISSSILGQLKTPAKNSHKGDNGRLLIIAGSDKYHGALLLALKAASRVVDMVYVHSVEQNLELIKNLKNELATFITVSKDELWQTVDLVDAVLIGPGLEESKEVAKLEEELITKYKDKKIIIDATTAWHLNPEILHRNCILTPHSREFTQIFKLEPTSENVLESAKKYTCVVVLKGEKDYISDGNELYENITGNVGMTKGGTGDVLAGLVAALSCTNDNLLSAQAGAYLNGVAGDNLYKEKNTFYNSEDVINELGNIWKEFI